MLLQIFITDLEVLYFFRRYHIGAYCFFHCLLLGLAGFGVGFLCGITSLELLDPAC